MLSRALFEPACKAFAHRHAQWTWVDGHHPGYGYLGRTTTHFFRKSSPQQFRCETEELFEEDDPAMGETASPALTVQEYIVYSASFSVPVFYFTIHDTNGTALTLAELLRTTFFKYAVPEGSEATSFSLTEPSSSFPVLSQGEHPTLGTACWYLHPCQSEAAVEEFMREEKGCEERMVRWLELWTMIVGGVVSL